MIWHFFEVWFLLLGTFVIGCGLGAGLYAGIGNSRLATAQGAAADAIGDIIDGIKSRFGLGADWRDGFRVPVERPLPRRAAPRRQEPRFDDEYADEPVAVSRPSVDEYPDDEEWDETDNRQEDRNGSRYAEEPELAEASFDAIDHRAAGRTEDSLPQEEDIVAKRPAGLLGPRNGVPDHLQRIRGIGKGNEELLNSLGIYHFGQIAAWTPAEAQWVAARMPFPERIERDDWVGQAIILASGGDTGYVKSAERRRARRAGAEEDDEGTAK